MEVEDNKQCFNCRYGDLNETEPYCRYHLKKIPNKRICNDYTED